MRTLALALSLACLTLTAANAEMAAPPTPAPPAAAVPDQMPFDVPYGESINLAKATKAIEAAIAEASKSPRNWKLSVVVVDPSGEIVALHKMDQTQIASIGISIGKARTAARFRRPSSAFASVMASGTGGYVATLGDPPPTASPGGFPLVENGKLIGAIGCSGATGDQDAAACRVGSETIK